MSQTPAPPNPDARLIEAQADFEAALPRLAAGGILSVDTEAASFHRYHDRIYLIQLSSREETVIVDPLAVGDLGLLGRVLADPAVEIVFHDADYDLRLFEHQFGFRPTRLFDTRVAAQFLNEPGIGLAALLEKYFGLRPDKRFQRADWSARPLSAPMLAYAATDTHFLAALRDTLEGRLRAAGRWDWVTEEFALIEGTRWEAAEDAEPGWLRMKGAKALKPRELAVLRALYEWRDEQARKLDRAAFRIMNNEPMFAMAKAPPTDEAALRAVRGLGAEMVERRGKHILAAVQRALALPESKLPRVPRPPRRPPDLEYEARLDRLKAARNELAQKHDLQPGVLCPNQTLEAIARANPETLDALAAVPGLRRWQLATFGPELLAATRESAPAA